LGNTVSVLPVGGSLGGGGRWVADLSRHTAPDKSLGGRITVAVIKSGSGQDFIRKIRSGPHLLVVADEVHNMGTSTGRRVIGALQKTEKRLGLSATYRRANDEEGTTAIEEFFGDVLPPVFGIKEAIKENRLVPYYYDFEVCNLTDKESERFEALSKKIMNLRNRDDGESSAALKVLLSQRARVIKGAAGKVLVAKEVFKKFYSDDDRWLVYCDDKNQLEQVYEILTNSGYPCAKFYADMAGSKTDTLDYLTLPGRVVIAIKCLDEGINIPEVDKALILASSTNPREYIQRRGRVLRKSKNKTKATIIDVLVLDDQGHPVLKSEVERMQSFMDDAMNEAARIKLIGFLSGGMLESVIEDFEEEEEEL
jgi:superfamily II DNA or RNA helicase